ncbi:hypothetical protein ABZ345_02255 [Lentzea sp. NPDC005914]|uniref:hypothetical protein n=1 Tax=Lentzea sp. NPDC005914 TaxID=3154572 RepID=UPI0033CDCA6A
MRVPGFLLALLLVLVGTSARQDVTSTTSGSGLSASVSVVHVLTVPSPDACWALCRAGEGSRPSQSRAAGSVSGAFHLDTTTSGPRSSRAPPCADAPGSRTSPT